jgi:hypothetical protein
MHRHWRTYFERSRRVEVYHPGHFVAWDQRFTDNENARSAVGVVVQVRPTDSDVAHPQPHLAGTWLRTWNLLGPHVLLGVDPDGPHTVMISFEKAHMRST